MTAVGEPDPRVDEHAELLVDWTTKVESGDAVVIEAGRGSHDLVVALSAAIARRDATVLTTYTSTEAMAAYLRANPGDPEPPRHAAPTYADADVVIRIRTEPGLFERDVPKATCHAYKRAEDAALRADGPMRRCVTQHPTREYAERAGMSLEEYRDFVYGATLRDWDAMSRKQTVVASMLDDAESVEIVGPDTDLSMRVDGMRAFSGIGDFNNLPDGEVGTAPNPAETEGHVAFDEPVLFRGDEIDGVELTFEGGEVVAADATRNRDALDDLLAVDDGARRLGEFGIGMNEAVDRYTRNLLFDEKMAGTIHLALGRAYAFPVGEGRTRNLSAIHVDFIKDVTPPDVRVLFDGEELDESLLF